MKIAICTPCYDGKVYSDHMRSAIETDRLARQRGDEIVFIDIPGNANLPKVRNRLAAAALAAGCEWIVMIDADIAWDAPDFFKLISHGHGLVGAGPAKRHHRWDEKPAAVAKFVPGDIVGLITNVGRLWSAQGVATAMLAIHRNVFKMMEKTTTEYVTDGVKVRNWFWFDLVPADGGGMEDQGEDYSFCRKFIKAAGASWVDPDVRLRHYSGTVCHDVCFADGETTILENADAQ